MIMMHVPELARLTKHPVLASTKEDGNNGCFIIRQTNGRELWIIASDGSAWNEIIGTPVRWEHVSVHVFDGKRTMIPRWEEMCKVKDIFWDEEDTIIQFHPKKSEYVNQHPHTLHLWRCIDIEIPTPPKITVGFETGP